jgi:hypothetical protein
MLGVGITAQRSAASRAKRTVANWDYRDARLVGCNALLGGLIAWVCRGFPMDHLDPEVGRFVLPPIDTE